MEVSEFVGVVHPAPGLGCFLLDHRLRTPHALLVQANEAEEMRTCPTVDPAACEEVRVAYPPGLEHPAILGVVPTAVATFGHSLPLLHPHVTHSTKGEGNRQMGEQDSPRWGTEARLPPRSLQTDSLPTMLLPVIVIVIVVIPLLFMAYRAAEEKKYQPETPH